ncbi:tyrosine-type recombinase/integrase [Sulfurimonas sp.]|uniref:tyrosine-type recombinase/integrase n=1 Tax=Sulfurimonas sp. TaxID=2022749 RepID=UPI003563930E
MSTSQFSKELEAFLEYISVTKALNKKSIEAYMGDLSSIEAELDSPLINIDSDKLLNLLSKYENKRTLNRKLSSVNAFFDFCYSSNFVQEKTKLKSAKIPKLLPKFLSLDQLSAGIKLCDTTNWLGLRDAALLYFLYASGVRISECLSLTKEDMDGEWLLVRHAKGDKERLVPVAKVALDALKRYLDAMPYEKDFLWCNYKGDRLSRVSAFKITQKYLGVSPHVLRHSYATALITGGADLRVVQELLGHASLITTQVYTHIQKQHLSETVDVCHPFSNI